MPAQRVIPTGTAETGTKQVSTYAPVPPATGIPVVYYDTTRERKDINGKLVKA
jgi:hypothetical protein